MFMAFCRTVVEWCKVAMDWAGEHHRVTLAIVCVLLGLLLAKTVFAAEPEFDPEAIVVVCHDDMCSIQKKDLGAFAKEFMKMSAELKLLRNKRCLSNMTTA